MIKMATKLQLRLGHLRRSGHTQLQLSTLHQREDNAASVAAKNLLRRRCTFRLHDSFVMNYSKRNPPFGFNGLGELVYMRTLTEENSRKEEWFETVRRVVEGCFSLQWRHCENVAGIGFDSVRARLEAEQMFDDIFNMRFLPPGRGLWAMGTAITEERAQYAALNNCAFVSTVNIDTNPRGVSDPFVFLMDAAMLGVGVGFDTRGSNCAKIRIPQQTQYHLIDDSREGWVKSVRLLLDAFFDPSSPPLPQFDYSALRPAGSAINGFGGTSQGPEPLQQLHTNLVDLLSNNVQMASQLNKEGMLSGRTIVDIMNLIGRCVVSSNVRRTAEIAFGFLPGEEPTSSNLSEDETPFLELKDYSLHPERAEYGWVSNNSVLASVGKSDYGNASIIDAIRLNGEPGFAWPDNMAQFGRMRMAGQHDLDDASIASADGFTVLSGNDGSPKAGEIAGRDELGGNPCLEQTLESYELCCLVECFPDRHLLEEGENPQEAKTRFLRTLKSALLYAKTVSLAPTHWGVTNRVMARNRRLGVSLSGLQQFIARTGDHGPGLDLLRVWCEEGYRTLRAHDHELSSRFAVRPSIKITSIKPSGSVSLLAGATPGLHFPEARYYLRRIRLSKQGDAALVIALSEAGYHVEEALDDDRCDIVSVPIAIGQSSGDAIRIRTLDEVSMFEQLLMASFMQRHWADNQVSCTVTFDPETESNHIPAALSHFQYMLKGISFLPRAMNRLLSDDDAVGARTTHPYPQMPYERITPSEYENTINLIQPLSLQTSIGLVDPEMSDVFCENDRCEVAK